MGLEIARRQTQCGHATENFFRGNLKRRLAQSIQVVKMPLYHLVPASVENGNQRQQPRAKVIAHDELRNDELLQHLRKPRPAIHNILKHAFTPRLFFTHSCPKVWP